jgi:hypothetical protein
MLPYNKDITECAGIAKKSIGAIRCEVVIIKGGCVRMPRLSAMMSIWIIDIFENVKMGEQAIAYRNRYRMLNGFIPIEETMLDEHEYCR